MCIMASGECSKALKSGRVTCDQIIQSDSKLKNQMVVAIKEGLATHSGVTEIAIVGHSMGGAIASFLSIHLMNEKDLVPKDVTLKLIAFGAPRCVNQDFARKYWPQVVDSYCAVRGEHAFIEYSVKAFNDGGWVISCNEHFLTDNFQAFHPFHQHG